MEIEISPETRVIFSQPVKKEMNADAFDDDTYDFVHLWEFAQGWRHFHVAISEDDVSLLEQLVDCQNFSVALDLLQMRMAKYGESLPHDVHQLACRRRKCVKVRDTTAYERVPPPTLEEFHRKRPAPTDYLAPPWTDTDIAESVVSDDRPNESSAALIRQQNDEYEAALQQDMANQCTPWAPMHETTVSCQAEPLEGPDTVKVVITVSPSGARFEKRFLSTAVLHDVAAWLKSVSENPTLSFFTNFPRTHWPLETHLFEMPVDRQRLSLFAEAVKDDC